MWLKGLLCSQDNLGKLFTKNCLAPGDKIINAPEDLVIAPSPNVPTHCDYDIHEERQLKLVFKALKDLKCI
jgi:hypothetical protein